MKAIIPRYFFIIILFTAAVNTQAEQHGQTFTTTDYVRALKKVTNVMIDDVTSPVAASRYYAYLTIASNEVLSLLSNQSETSFANRLHGFTGITITQPAIQNCNKEFAAVLMLYKMGAKLLPSGYLLKSQSDSLILMAQKKGIDKETVTNTNLFTDNAVQQLLPYIKSDGFTQLNNLRRYTPANGDGYWQPTPPVFMAPVEPHWNTLRTFVLDSAQQFKPLPPAVYDTNKNTAFFKLLQEVYQTTTKADKQKKAIAMFWDCNPFAVQQIGHVQFGLKKISPGGHWVGITGIACNSKKFSLQKTAAAHALVSIALADAFIACWDEKYRSNRIRPETAIKKLIDPYWKPLLQTPPFPEYVSGHSVASTTAAAVLTKIFGNNFSFVDDTEVEFNLPAKKFMSFNAAAAEASVSRLYGGIHYRDAINNGIWQGKQISTLFIERLQNQIEIFK